MNEENKRPFSFYMRILHRDIGFFMIGMTIIFSLSGIMLIYRETDFLKEETQIEKTLQPGLNGDQLREKLQMKDFRIVKTEGDIVYFQNGTYNTTTGYATYNLKKVMFPFNKMTDLHKTSTKKMTHWAILCFGSLLFFMAISAFWMIPRESRFYKRSMILAGLGIIFALLMVFL